LAPFKSEISLNNIKKRNSYLTETHYKQHPVNAVYENDHCLFKESQNTITWCVISVDNDDYATGGMTYESGLYSSRGQVCVLFCTESRWVPGPTQPSIQRMPRSISFCTCEGTGREHGGSLPYSAEVKNGGAILDSPFRYHAVCLNMQGGQPYFHIQVTTLIITTNLIDRSFQIAGKNRHIKITNRSFENVSQLKYLGTALANQNLIPVEIKRRLNSDNACYHSVQNLLSSRLLSKSVKIRIYKTIILPMVLCGSETCSLTLREEHRLRAFESKVLRTTYGQMSDEVTEEWRNCITRSFMICILHQVQLE
jgi:hypothetical protein